MGFSGGGSNVLLPHTHDGTVSQDGGALQFNNVTQASLNSGDTTYSDGVHLQQLAIGTPAQVMTVSGANLPAWSAAGGGATLTKTFLTSTTSQSTTSAVFINATTFTMTCTAGSGKAICWYGTPYQNIGAGGIDMELRYNFSVDGATTPLIFHNSTAGGAVWENAEVFGVSDTLGSQTIDLQFRSPFGGSSTIQRASYAGIMYVLEIA